MFTCVGKTFKNDLSCCGMHLATLSHGGCGGLGSVYGCLVCRKKYMQASGGLASSPLKLEQLDQKMTDAEYESARKEQVI